MTYVVVGVWEMSEANAEERLAGFRNVIVPGVRQAPGLSKEYWTADVASTRAYTWIMFDDRSSAEAFAADVRANTAEQAKNGVTSISLAVTEVSAET